MPLASSASRIAWVLSPTANSWAASGVIATREIKPGNFVQINTPIFTIVDTSRLEATLNVPEREFETLKAGQAVQLTADAMPGKTFEGRIDRVSPVVDSGSGTFRVISTFEGGGLLQPGMFGRVRISYDQRANALVIPRNALLDATAPHPFVRKIIVRALTVLPKPVEKHGFALGLDLEGKVIANLQDAGAGNYSPITTVREYGDWLYFGSLKAKNMARLPLSTAL